MSMFQRSLTAGALLVAALAFDGSSALASGVPPLAAHRAVYDLKLGETRGSSGIQSIRGRIVYDFSGTACEGYALKFRQVTEISTENGANVSDLRSATFEDDAGKSFQFNSQNFVNDKLDTAIDGHAQRADGGVAVDLRKPSEKSFNVTSGVIFPTAQIKAIIDAARNGKTVFESKIYDGSDGGEKVYDTLAVIGRKIAPEKPREAAATRKELDGVDRWPVTISYFDPSKESATGEQTPVYSITFELYANGISGSIKLDYGDFTLDGEMASLELLPQPACP